MTVLLVIAKIVIVLALGAVAVLLGGRAVTRVFRLAERTRATELPEQNSAPETVAPLTYAATYLRGGEWIGYLERLAVFGALLAGFPEGIAVAMVVKSFARYPKSRPAVPVPPNGSSSAPSSACCPPAPVPWRRHG